VSDADGSPAADGPDPGPQSARAALSSTRDAWKRLPGRRRKQIWAATLLTLLLVVAALRYMAGQEPRVTVVNEEHPGYTYFLVFLMIALDAVMPIFPGETTLNAASTAAANGNLDLAPIIVMGALGAIVGDSSLFWIARKYSHHIEPQLTRAKANSSVRTALDYMNKSAPVLIIGGRYVPGMRFVVNATMGLSEMPYRRFLPWSVFSGVLWSTYTCWLAYEIGLALGEYPLASFVISGLVTTVAITVVFFTLRRQRRRAAEAGSG
jgi:membrane protein DedA with SNARE-associated domain